MKRRSLVITIAILAIMLGTACAPAFAQGAHLVEIPANQVWTPGGSELHDTGFSHAGARIVSVSPLSGFDLFANLRCRILNSSGTVILKNNNGYQVLSEGSSVTPLPIKNGYYNTSIVFYQYSGNSSAAANAIVWNYGTYDVDNYDWW